jgi:hypothetical protein
MVFGLSPPPPPPSYCIENHHFVYKNRIALEEHDPTFLYNKDDFLYNKENKNTKQY